MNDKPQYEIAPSDDQLSEVDRELRFFECQNDAPKTLTSEQIQQYNSNGYLTGFTAFTTEQATNQRDYFDTLLQKTIAAGGDSYSISTAHLQYGRVYDLLGHPNIVAIVTDLLGANVVGWGTHYFCKMPKDGKAVAWHQDATYWPLTPSKTATVWLAIDDTDLENACMKFVAGSHRFGHIEHQAHAGDQESVLDRTIENVEQYGSVVANALSAGQFSVHSDLLLHGSAANHSDRRRCGLTLRYCAADVKAGLDWHKKGVVACGTDATNHWANPSRPAED